MTKVQFGGRCSDSHERPDYDAFINKWGVSDKWHPSLHMPKEAARIFLRAKDVRVERLQDITPSGAVDEGAVKNPHYIKYGGERCLTLHSRYRDEFAKLWDSTVKKADFDTYGWDANPWVWVIDFERISAEEAKEG